jgi:hypothetical protein
MVTRAKNKKFWYGFHRGYFDKTYTDVISTNVNIPGTFCLAAHSFAAGVKIEKSCLAFTGQTAGENICLFVHTGETCFCDKTPIKKVGE